MTIYACAMIASMERDQRGRHGRLTGLSVLPEIVVGLILAVLALLFMCYLELDKTRRSNERVFAALSASLAGVRATQVNYSENLSKLETRLEYKIRAAIYDRTVFLKTITDIVRAELKEYHDDPATEATQTPNGSPDTTP